MKKQNNMFLNFIKVKVTCEKDFNIHTIMYLY